MRERLDVVIIGAGVAGLALGQALSRQGRRIRAVILEAGDLRPNHRQWLFPAMPGHALQPYEAERLSGFQVKLPTGAVVERQLSRLYLSRVPAQRAQGAAIETIEGRQRIRLETQARVDSLTQRANRVDLETSLGALRATWVIDTRPPQNPDLPEGQAVQITALAASPMPEKTPSRVIFTPNPDVAGLGQALISEDGGVAEQVHLTLAPPQTFPDFEPLGAELNAHGAVSLPEQIRTARGVFPLRTRSFASVKGRLIYAPADAHGFRFAPGMAALRLYQWAERQARRLSYGLSLHPPSGPDWRARLATWRLAQLLTEAPERARDQFNRLVLEADPDEVVRVLSGQPLARDLWCAYRQGRW